MISDDDLMLIVRDEKSRSLGYDGETDSGDLQDSRLRALNYYAGDLSDDIPNLPNRSAANDSLLKDSLLQLLPQLIEVFMDEDVASFRPTNAQDIDAAALETAYINQVLTQENKIFEYLNAAFRDALLLKTGYLTWSWIEPDEPETTEFKALQPPDLLNLQQIVQAGKANILSVSPNEDQTYDVVLQAPRKMGHVEIKAWDALDVAVSNDTIKLGDGTYCGFRTRVRRDQLIADGYDPEIVADIPRYGALVSELQHARDRAGEYEDEYASSAISGMDVVQVYYHYVRVLEDDNKMRLYRVTAAGEDLEVMLRREAVDSVPACYFTPFPIAHRHFGESLADLVVETQAVKTSLLRMALDSGYFALNQRMIIAEDGASKDTLNDILDNIPGAPIRAKTVNAVAPVQSSGFDYQIWQALEYMSTKAEQESGVLRSTMGINADSLHETRGGMLAQLNMGQTRVRFMARNFAETGFRDLVLGVHDCIRRNASMADIVAIGGQYVPIDPTSWGERSSVDLRISNGRDFDVAALSQVITTMRDVVQVQGGLSGPLVTAQNAAYTLQAWVRTLGRKDASAMFADPQAAQAQVQNASPPPDPAAMKVQADQQAQQATLQLQAQRQASEAQMSQAQQASEVQLRQSELALKAQDADRAHQLAMIKLENEQKIARYRVESELALKRYQIDQELKLKAGEIAATANLDAASIHTDATLDAHKMALDHAAKLAALPDVRPGGGAG